jgi:hypothetical protein
MIVSSDLKTFTFLVQATELGQSLQRTKHLGVPYFNEYSAHFFTLKMMPNCSLHTLHGR